MSQDWDVCEEICIHAEAVQKAKQHALSQDKVQLMADTFKALGDPTRVRIIHALTLGEMCVCDLSTVLEMTQSAVSHQLRSLRGLRLVKTRREGKVVYYSLDDDHIIGLFNQGLEHVNHQ